MPSVSSGAGPSICWRVGPQQVAAAAAPISIINDERRRRRRRRPCAGAPIELRSVSVGGRPDARGPTKTRLASERENKTKQNETQIFCCAPKAGRTKPKPGRPAGHQFAWPKIIIRSASNKSFVVVVAADEFQPNHHCRPNGTKLAGWLASLPNQLDEPNAR